MAGWNTKNNARGPVMAEETSLNKCRECSIGKLKIKDINMDHYEFSIKSVSHSFNDQAYIISVEFES